MPRRGGRREARPIRPEGRPRQALGPDRDRRRRQRRRGGVVRGGVVTVVAGAWIVAAFAWVAGGSIVLLDLGLIRWSLLTVHAVAGIALLPLVLVHLAPRRWRVLRVRTARVGKPIAPGIDR